MDSGRFSSGTVTINPPATPHKDFNEALLAVKQERAMNDPSHHKEAGISIG
jgi:hypothetical protein